jgi:hypothetical protein
MTAGQGPATCWSVSSHHEPQEAHQEPEKENVSRSKADT